MLEYKEGNEVIVETKTYCIEETDLVVQALKAGCIVAIATDTVMGLAARADLLPVYEKLRKVKGNREDKPFPVMVANMHQLEKIVSLNSRNKLLAKKWFPGAITFIFNTKISSILVGVKDTVAVRIPDDQILLDIVSKLDLPIFLTSANKSNQPTTKKAKEVFNIFKNEISGVLMTDAKGYQPSTIIDLTGSKLKMLREGNISLESVIESLEE
ncbi:MAG: threonylcarbamoyl-AMP synthase [Erysipelothrix sp.]|nr:threonylcarbamoyl-AMP synthase [Erysipelothrix sp.]